MVLGYIQITSDTIWDYKMLEYLLVVIHIYYVIYSNIHTYPLLRIYPNDINQIALLGISCMVIKCI